MNSTTGATAFFALFVALFGASVHRSVAAAPPATTAPTSQPIESRPPAPAPLATLTVKVTDLRNHHGQMIFGVFKSADGFPKVQSKSINWQVKPIDSNSVVFTVSLPPGKYAASALHDENKNGKMDMTFWGVPEEGYGVTNNPKPEYRQARFDEATFNLPPQGATLIISLQYF